MLVAESSLKTMDVVKRLFLETCKLSPINAAKFMVNHERVAYLSVSFNLLSFIIPARALIPHTVIVIKLIVFQTPGAWG